MVDQKYYVYFIQQGGGGNQPIKIGISDDPDRRLVDLQTGNPTVLKIQLAIPFESRDQAFRAERTFHRTATFGRHKSHSGEWFTIIGSWEKFIKDAYSRNGINRNQPSVENSRWIPKREVMLTKELAAANERIEQLEAMLADRFI